VTNQERKPKKAHVHATVLVKLEIKTVMDHNAEFQHIESLAFAFTEREVKDALNDYASWRDRQAGPESFRASVKSVDLKKIEVDY
jgi:hypothetical protein